MSPHPGLKKLIAPFLATVSSLLSNLFWRECSLSFLPFILSWQSQVLLCRTSYFSPLGSRDTMVAVNDEDRFESALMRPAILLLRASFFP